MITLRRVQCVSAAQALALLASAKLPVEYGKEKKCQATWAMFKKQFKV